MKLFKPALGVQANVMMLGETMCMVAYVLYWLCGGVDTSSKGESPPLLLFLPPALCDVTVGPPPRPALRPPP